MDSPDDFDQTQAVVLEDVDEDDLTDELESDEEKKPAAFIRVLFQKGLTETTYPLYEGDNIIGRHADTCHVCIPSKSLSKEHACVQIAAGSHLISDKGSRNKTHRGKLFLRPEAWYELKHGDEVAFADVKCIYEMSKQISETVAETDSDNDTLESLLLHHDVTEEHSFDVTNNQSDANYTKHYSVERENISVPGTEVFSESDNEEKQKNKSEVVQETLLFDDSDPETSGDQFMFAAATQAYTVKGNSKDNDETDSSEIATQAYTSAWENVEEEEEALRNEPTQAFVHPLEEKKGPPNSVHKQLSLQTGTQSFEPEVKSIEGDTQSFEGAITKNSIQKDPRDTTILHTQVFDEDEDESSMDTDGLFAVSTVAYDGGDNSDGDEGINSASTDANGLTQGTGVEAPTQTSATQPYDNIISGKVKNNSDATVALTEPVKNFVKEINVATKVITSPSDAPAQIFDRSQAQRASESSPLESTANASGYLQCDPESSDNMSTQVFDETISSDITQVSSRTVDLHNRSQVQACRPDNATIVSSDATLSLSIIGRCKGTPKIDCHQPIQTLGVSHDPTQIFIDSKGSELAENKSKKGNHNNKHMEELGFSDDDSEPSENICITKDCSDELTQVYGIVEGNDTQTFSDDNGDGVEAATALTEQVYCPDDADATQLFMDSETLENGVCVEGDGDEPTQNFCEKDTSQKFDSIELEAASDTAAKKLRDTSADCFKAHIHSDDDSDLEDESLLKVMQEPFHHPTHYEYDSAAKSVNIEALSNKPKQNQLSQTGKLRSSYCINEETDAIMDADEVVPDSMADDTDERSSVITLPFVGSPLEAAHLITSPAQKQLEQSTEKEDLQQSTEKDDLQQSTEKDDQQSTEKDDLKQSTEKDDLQQSTEKDDQQSTEKDDLQQSTEKGDLQQSIEKDDLQQSTEKDDLQQSTEKDDLQQSTERDDLQQPVLKDNKDTTVKSRRSTRRRETLLIEESNELDSGSSRLRKARNKKVVSQATHNNNNNKSMGVEILADDKREKEPVSESMEDPKVADVGNNEIDVSLAEHEREQEPVSESMEDPKVADVGNNEIDVSLAEHEREQEPVSESMEDPKVADVGNNEIDVSLAEREREQEPVLDKQNTASEILKTSKTRRSVISRKDNVTAVANKKLTCLVQETHVQKTRTRGRKSLSSVVLETVSSKSGNEKDDISQPANKNTRRSMKLKRQVLDLPDTGDNIVGSKNVIPDIKEICGSDNNNRAAAQSEVEKAAIGVEIEEAAPTTSPVIDNNKFDVEKKEENNNEKRKGRRKTTIIRKEDISKSEINIDDSISPRVSSRGRRISTNRYLKDFETDKKTDAKSPSLLSNEKKRPTETKMKKREIVSRKTDSRKTDSRKTDSRKRKSDTEKSTGEESDSSTVQPSYSKKGRSKQILKNDTSRDDIGHTQIKKTSKFTEIGHIEFKQEEMTRDKPARASRRGEKCMQSEEMGNPSSCSLQTNIKDKYKNSEPSIENQKSMKNAVSNSSASNKKNSTEESSISNIHKSKRQKSRNPPELEMSSTESLSQPKIQNIKLSELHIHFPPVVESQPVAAAVQPKARGRGRKSMTVESGTNELTENKLSSVRVSRDKEKTDDKDSRESRTAKRLEAQIQVSVTPAKKSKLMSSPQTPVGKTEVCNMSAQSPSLRKSSIGHKPRVMFTGLIDEHGEKIVKDLGGEMASTIQECTHLVTDRIRRTVKFLSGLAKGLLIVSPRWLESCKQAGTFIDGRQFLVSDPAMEKQYKFNLASSISRAQQGPMLTGYRVHVSKSVKPDPNQMQDVLTCAGADYLTTMPGKSHDNTVVISCKEDHKLCQPAIKAGIPIMEVEFILTGILRQELDFKSSCITTPVTTIGQREC